MVRDNIILGIMCLVAAAGLILGAIAIIRSLRQMNKQRLPATVIEDVLAGQSGRSWGSPRSGSRVWVAVAISLCGLWLSSEYWSSQKTKAAEKSHLVEVANWHEEVQAAMDAAAQPIIPAPAATKQGYVYLGQCDKLWVPGTARFTRMPPCREPLPDGGFKLISRKGDVIRASAPQTINGKRQFGAEISRVSAGYSVVLRKMIAVSVFASGPQYYWGLVDFPTDSPARPTSDEQGLDRSTSQPALPASR